MFGKMKNWLGEGVTMYGSQTIPYTLWQPRLVAIYIHKGAQEFTTVRCKNIKLNYRDRNKEQNGNMVLNMHQFYEKEHLVLTFEKEK